MIEEQMDRSKGKSSIVQILALNIYYNMFPRRERQEEANAVEYAF